MDYKRISYVMGTRVFERDSVSPGQVPWPVFLLAMEEYNKHHDQSADQLSGRGGFSWCELIAAIRGDYSEKGARKVKEDLERVITNYDMKTQAGKR